MQLLEFHSAVFDLAGRVCPSCELILHNIDDRLISNNKYSLRRRRRCLSPIAPLSGPLPIDLADLVTNDDYDNITGDAFGDFLLGGNDEEEEEIL